MPDIKTVYCMISIGNIRIGKSVGTESRSVVASGLKEEKLGVKETLRN